MGELGFFTKRWVKCCRNADHGQSVKLTATGSWISLRDSNHADYGTVPAITREVMIALLAAAKIVGGTS